MNRRVRPLVAIGVAACCASACYPAPDQQRRVRATLVLGIDVSGSFHSSGHYDDAIDFAANYLYGRLNGYGDLRVPTAVFVGSVGGAHPGETKSFQPAHAFHGKTAAEIATMLRELFPAEDDFTDFNAFFDRVASLVKRRGLALSPLDVVILSDGIPDATGGDGPDSPYARIDVSPLEYLARSVTVRLLYSQPTVSVEWERRIRRQRVRMWTVDAQVMQGWREHAATQEVSAEEAPLWDWIQDNVDFRVRSRRL